MNNDLIIKLAQPYTWEDKQYTEIDLTAMEAATSEDYCKAERIYEASGSVSVVKDLNMKFAFTFASVTTGIPIEFFGGLPIKVGYKVRKAVTGFFNAEG